ncbi:two-component regulator propeller domain-containing protein [Balneola sp. MJW-20]|uniref:sensor histidine kinase n=1 Tax=Gracilimonas aurantiaca TaxID=3234185 RepID=UPI00346726A2
MKIKLSLSAVLLMILWGNSFAQKYPFRTYSIEQGLTESVVYDIEQDSDGYIWLATSFGLTRYDGVVTTSYFEENGLNNNTLHSVYEDNFGRLWIGSESGVNYWEEDSIQKEPDLDALQSSTILSIFQDSNGALWFGTDGDGVWNYSNGRLIQYTTVNGLSNNRVRAITEDDKGTLYFATRGGLTSLNDGSFRVYTMNDGLPEDRLRDVVFAGNGKVLIGSRNGLVIFQDGVTEIINESEGLLSANIWAIETTSEGGIWLGAEGGVSFYQDGKVQNYTTEQGLSNNIVTSVMSDREGNMWFGTNGGGASIFFGNYFSNYDTDMGLPNNVVLTITGDKEGRIWFGMYGGGITALIDGEFNDLNINSALPDNKIYNLFVDSKNVLWISMSDGLATYEEGVLKVFADDQFPFRKVRNVMEASDNSYWISLEEEGLVHYEEGKFTRYDESHGMESSSIRKVIEDESGDIWIATFDGGISRWDGENFDNFTISEGLPNNSVTDIYIDSENRLWATTAGGFVWFDGERFQSITQDDGMPDKKAYFIHEGENGYYWLGSTKGVIRFDANLYFSQSGNEQAFKLITNDQGLIGDELNSGAVFEDREGYLWFGTVEGVSRFDPRSYLSKKVPPIVHLISFNASGRNYRLRNGNTLEYDQNYVEIEYSGINMTAPDQVIYQYRMSGVDPDWQQTTNRIVKYPSVPSGEHLFEVRARNPEGDWSEEVKKIRFSVAYPFWLSWWFLTIIAIAVISIILLFYNYYKARKLIDIERMRVRIASDLHDDVGASLTEIALQSDFLQAGKVDDEIGHSLQQIGKQCRRIVSSLDDIVWSIDARNDTLGDLTDRMQDYVLNTLESKNMAVTYDFDDLKMENKLPVELKENLYLIFKEAVNNVAKYSNGDKVEITMHNQNGSYELEIYDNGSKGKSAKKTGHGLRNMEMRAKRIGADIHIDPDNGFRITVTGDTNMN